MIDRVDEKMDYETRKEPTPIPTPNPLPPTPIPVVLESPNELEQKSTSDILDKPFGEKVFPDGRTVQCHFPLIN